MPRVLRGTTRRSKSRTSAPTSSRSPVPAQSELVTDLDRLHQTVGNRASVRLLSRRVLQRRPNRAQQQRLRQAIRDSITFFTGRATFYDDPTVNVTQQIVNRDLTDWYRTIVNHERTIDTDLRGDAGLRRDLRTAYIAAIRATIRRAAAVLNRPEADLYRENSGRIPMWAWQTPHRLERRISTPIREGLRARRGTVTFAVNGFSVTIAPDRTVRTLSREAVTRHNLRWRTPSYRTDSTGHVTRFSPPRRPTVRIQTSYRRGVTAATQSGYGRGTTPEDIAGGAVTRRSTTLGFHEGSHGLAFVEFMEQHAPPRFAGAVGMTEVEFQAEIQTWVQAMSDYADSMSAFSARQTDCVGTTIDQFNQAGAPQGAQIVLECGP